jgi:hypothetical protein
VAALAVPVVVLADPVVVPVAPVVALAVPVVVLAVLVGQSLQAQVLHRLVGKRSILPAQIPVPCMSSGH